MSTVYSGIADGKLSRSEVEREDIIGSPS